MKLVEEFGINPMLLGAQIVNFIIILFLLRRFLYRPFLNLLEARKNAIKETLEKAQEAQARLEKALADEKRILSRAQAQALKLIEDAKNLSEKMQKDAAEKALKQTEKILKEAQAQIERQTKESEEQLTAHVSNLAISFLKKSLANVFTKENQADIMNKVFKKIGGKAN